MRIKLILKHLNCLILFLILLECNLLSQELSRHYKIFNKNIINSVQINNIDSITNNLHISYNTKNNAFDFSDRFNDKNNFLISWMNQYHLSNRLLMRFSAFIENVKYDPVNEYIKYWKYDFSKISGGVYQGYFKYSSKNVVLKFGRDIFSMGYNTLDRLLFSTHAYPLDHILLTFEVKNFSLSSYYLSLNAHPLGSDAARHINGHRLNYISKNGYVSISEIALYGGENEPLNFALFNPLLVYYLYQDYYKFSSNIIYSFEWFYKKNKYDLFFEFVLDDFQIDKKIPADLEPTEYAILFEANYLINNKYKTTFKIMKVANRTFNAPVFDYEKMLNNTIPLGHYLGNNFWKTSFWFSSVSGKNSYNLVLEKIVYGDESLYGVFNKEYLNFSIDEGYQEDFPFGLVNHKHRMIIDKVYFINKTVSFSSSIALDYDSINLKTFTDKLFNPTVGYSITFCYDVYN